MDSNKLIIGEALNIVFPGQKWEIVANNTQGKSAKLYQLISKDKLLIARISDPNRPGVNVANEHACIKQVAELGISPGVYHVNTEENFVIMDCINSLSPDEMLAKLDYHNLASAIATLHASGIDLPSHSIFEIVTMIGSAIKDRLSEYPEISRCLIIATQLRKSLDIEGDKRPSHRDLHFYNLLLDKVQLYFIDWESAGNESLYFDLAVAYNMIVNLQDTATSEEWLAAYFNKPATDEQLKKFHDMRIIAFIHYGLLCIYLSMAMNENRLAPDEVGRLPDYTHYLKQQIANHDPDITGNYFAFGISCLQAALDLAASD